MRMSRNHVMSDTCDIKRCKRVPCLYYGKDHKGVCEEHWQMYCNKKIDLKDKTIYKKNS